MHSDRQRSARHFEDEMKVRPHQAVTDARPFRPRGRASEFPEELHAISVAAEQHLLADGVTGHVENAFVEVALTPRHRTRMAAQTASRKCPFGSLDTIVTGPGPGRVLIVRM